MDSDPPLNKIIPVHIVYTMPTRYDLEHERQILDVVYVRYKLVVNSVVNVET